MDYNLGNHPIYFSGILVMNKMIFRGRLLGGLNKTNGRGRKLMFIKHLHVLRIILSAACTAHLIFTTCHELGILLSF